jgi:polysaccharide biosynthesis transport protein
MRPSAAEALKAAIRRALPLTLLLLLLGAIAINVQRQMAGDQYSASSRVVLSTSDLSAAVTGVEPDFIDPERTADTALALADSPEVYERAARRAGRAGDGGAVQGMTKVTGDKERDIIDFEVTTGDPNEAVRTANAVAASYVDWRADISSRAIRRAIRQVQARIATSPRGSRAVLREQLERLRVMDTLNSGGATVVDRATEADHVSPSPPRDTMLGLALGLVLAVLLSAGREALNTRVRSEADVEEALGKPVLASIQTLPKRAGLVTVGRYGARFGDIYALLAANIVQLHGQNRPLKLAVTSSIPSEGKTTTAANLALAMAIRGQRVALVDFDLRKPGIDRIFRIPQTPGVIQLVDGSVELDDAVWSVPLNGAAPAVGDRSIDIYSGNGGAGSAVDSSRGDEQGTGSLRIVPSGGVERGARVARSQQARRLLQELQEVVDVVILDTPPALATVEMAELSRNVDLVLVVVRHGQVSRRSILALNRQADGWQADIAGAVLTGSPSEEDDYYYQTP